MKTVSQIKIGDTVQLKSGGTTMSVAQFKDDGDVLCVWFDARDKIHRGRFPIAILHVIPQLF